MRQRKETEDVIEDRKDPHGRRLILPYEQSFVSCPILQTLMDRRGWFYVAPKGLFSVEFSLFPAFFDSHSFQRATNSGVLCVCRLHSPNRRNAPRPISMIKLSMIEMCSIYHSTFYIYRCRSSYKNHGNNETVSIIQCSMFNFVARSSRNVGGACW